MPIAWFGSPDPTATWLLNDSPVKAGEDNVEMLNEEAPRPATSDPIARLEQSHGGTFILRVPKARRANTGSYTVKIANDLGQVTSSCKVNVIGKFFSAKLVESVI